MTVRPIRRTAVAATAAATLLVATATAGSTYSAPRSSASADETVFPGAEWETAAPEAVGVDAAVLDEIALAAGSEFGSNCFAVVRHGRLVGEWYWNGATPDGAQEVFSVTKSITSALVGIAQANGDLDITEPASHYITAWQGTESGAVTIEDLLSNDSGREWSPGIDYGQMALDEPDKSAFSMGLGQMAAPDTLWAYNNSAIQTLSEVLQTSTGMEPSEFAEAELFGEIGMADSSISQDSAGNTLTFMGAQTTCRDALRFGLLYLNEGNWDGNEVIPADYVQASIGLPSQDLNASYGYLWWLNRPGQRLVDVLKPITEGSTDNTVTGQMVASAPADMYWASGLAGQWIQVDPGSDTVAVRLGPFGGDFPLDLLARVATDAVTDG